MKGYPAVTLLLNFWPGLHLLAVVCLWRQPVMAVLTLYLLPPVLARMIMAVLGKPVGKFPVSSRAFVIWWCLANLQSVFLRFPFLEELLRMVPTLYSNWLRLWGSRIGKNVYWAPGTRVVDRGYLDLGDQVVVGLCARLNPHHIFEQELTVAPIAVGDRAQLGGYSLLAAGCVVGPGECTLATMVMRPFWRFFEGKVWRNS